MQVNPASCSEAFILRGRQAVTQWSRLFIEKLISAHLVKKFL
jgi:hypothetical protein